MLLESLYFQKGFLSNAKKITDFSFINKINININYLLIVRVYLRDCE